MGGTTEAPSYSSGHKPLMKIPSYVGTQPLERYFGLFEAIYSKKEFEESEWLLRFCIALAASTAERIAIIQVQIIIVSVLCVSLVISLFYMSHTRCTTIAVFLLLSFSACFFF